MTPTERDELRERIRARLEQLERILEGTPSVADQHREQAQDAAADLDITISSTVDSTLLTRAKVERALLQANLTWLDDDDAGNCEKCGDRIPTARMMLIPTTRKCVRCAQEDTE